MSTIRLWRIGIIFLVTIALVAVAFYIWQGWSFLDAVYMVVLTISTVGFREVRPFTPAIKIFNIFFIVAGVVTLLWLVSMSVEVAIQRSFRTALLRRRLERTVKRMRDHYIICGYGRMGQEVAREFRENHVPFLVIEKDTREIEQLEETEDPFIAGDATEDEVLHRAGIERAKGLVTVTPRDEDNLYIVMSARVLNPALFIVSRCNAPSGECKLNRAGADRVVSPYVIGARRMAGAVLRPAVLDFLDSVMHTGQVAISLEALQIPAGSGLLGKALRDLDIKERTGAVAIARMHADGTLDTRLRGEVEFAEGDTLIVLGTAEQLAALGEMARPRGTAAT